MAAKFYFINKDAESDSLSHSDKRERIKIHSHVQLGRKAMRGCEVQTKPDSNEVESFRTPAKPQIYRWKSGQKTGKKRTRISDMTSKPSSPASSADSNNLDELSTKDLTQVSGLEPLLAKTYRTGSPVDPFDVACVKLDSDVQRLLLYYLHHAHPNTYYTETRYSHKHKAAIQTDAQNIIKESFDDPANMYTLLASMASRMKYLEKYEEQEDSTSLISKAIVAVQNRIKGNYPMSERMVFNLFQLGCAEFYRWDVAAAVVHLKALRVLVQHLGGFKNIHHSLAELIMLGDGYVAAEVGEAPLCSPNELDDNSEALTPKEGIEIMKQLLDGSRQIACGLLAPDQRSIVPAELRWIVMDMAVCLGVLQDHTANSDAGDAPANILHWLHLRNLGIRHRLATLELEDNTSEALRIALLMWDFYMFTVAGRVRTVKVVGSRLKERLERVSDKDWTGHEEAHLWIVMIGGISASPGSELEHWYVEKGIQAMRLVGTAVGAPLEDFEDFSALASKFLYSTSLQEQPLLRFWNRMHRKGSEGVDECLHISARRDFADDSIATDEEIDPRLRAKT